MMFPDGIVHFRLCEFWFIELVVTVFSVTYNIDKNILLVL